MINKAIEQIAKTAKQHRYGEKFHAVTQYAGAPYSVQLSYTKGHGYDVTVVAEDGTMNYAAAVENVTGSICDLIEALHQR